MEIIKSDENIDCLLKNNYYINFHFYNFNRLQALVVDCFDCDNCLNCDFRD